MTFARAAACALVLGLGVACSGGDDDGGPVAEGPAEVTFPPGFMWGSATAGFQVEKDLPGTDWGAWVATEGKIKNGDDPNRGGPDAFAHVEEDVAFLKATGQNAYRFSVELARVYPTKAAFDADQPDPAGVAAYDALFTALREAHITPLVTLQHFVLPDWLSDPSHADAPQGWERDETVTAFATWCERAAKRWGGDVDWWATINEPLVTPLAGYVGGTFPPGLVLQVDRALAAAKGEVRGHARCYDAVKAADTTDADGDGKASWVGIVHHLRAVEPEDPTNPDDVAAADRVRYVNNAWFLNAVIKGDLDDDFDGALDGPKDQRAAADLAHRSDYVGVNYYTNLWASSSGFKVPVVNAAIRQDHIPDGRPKTDFYWDIYPEGLRVVLDEVAPYGVPIVITENGIADSQDNNRGRFLLEHLYVLGRAIGEGVDVRGYFHWSLVDNFEWNSGYCPRFGLQTYDPATGARTARPSASVLAKIIASGKVRRADVDAAPPYGPPAFCD